MKGELKRIWEEVGICVEGQRKVTRADGLPDLQAEI
jgi:hypothetical protein